MTCPSDVVHTSDENDLPLSTRIEAGVLKITVGLKTIAHAAENHADFWDPEADKYRLKVTDVGEFASEVLRALTRENEIGDCAVMKLLDSAIVSAINDGAQGVEVEEEQ